MDKRREPATPGPCPRCQEWIDHESYWEMVGDAPGRDAGWKLKHRKADGTFCRIRGGPASTEANAGVSERSETPALFLLSA